MSNNHQSKLKFDSELDCSENGEHLDTSALENWLWDAACSIRGVTDAPKFKDFILPLIFYKRLSDVFDDKLCTYIKEFGNIETAYEIVEGDHMNALASGQKSMVGFFIPRDYRWKKVRHHSVEGIGEFLSTAMREIAKVNPDLQGVLDIKDYNERQSGQRTISDDRLSALIEIISEHRLGLKNTEPDVLGRAYEYLLRKFAEGQGQSAGEFYTPKEIGWLIAQLINPGPLTTIYDPTCGSGGLLIKARLYYENEHPNQKSKAPQLYGQELNPVTFAIAKMNMFIHEFMDSHFAIDDTFRNPGFGVKGVGLKQFDYVVANPMWNQDNYDEAFYETDNWNRFTFGKPPNSSADWGWVQHIFASLNDKGKAAIVLDTGAATRGSRSKSSSKEKNIREAFVLNDYIEAVILLPDNLFYNTNAQGIILLLNKNKAEGKKGHIQFINASNYYEKEKPKNVMTIQGCEIVVNAYEEWNSIDKISKIASIEEIRDTDFNLSPSLYVNSSDTLEHRQIENIIKDLRAVKKNREGIDAQLDEILNQLGL